MTQAEPSLTAPFGGQGLAGRQVHRFVGAPCEPAGGQGVSDGTRARSSCPRGGGSTSFHPRFEHHRSRETPTLPRGNRGRVHADTTAQLPVGADQ
jgi:hypothetical protein